MSKAQRNLSSNTARMNKSLVKMERIAKRSLRRVNGALLSLAAGFSLTVAVRKSLGDFADFERGLIGIGKTTGASGKELESLGVDIQEIARRVPVATKELLAIGQAAGQLGVKGSENITRFVETVGKLGIASDLAGERAATTLARILTVTDTDVGQVDRLASAIVDLGNNFAATESEIAASATRVAQSTAQFETSAAEVAGIGAALRTVGIEAEAGGSVIGRAFQSINDAVRSGGSGLQALEKIIGSTGKEIQETFQRDSTEVFRRFVEGLGRIQKSGGDVSAALETVGLTGVRVVQVLGTLATRSDVLGQALDRSNTAFKENTALNVEALVATKSFTAQMQLVSNVVNEAAAEIGRALAPKIVELTGDLRDFIIEARKSGELEQMAKNIGGAFAFMARNLDLLVTAGAAFIALRFASSLVGIATALGPVLAVLGPFGIALGVASAAILLLIANTEQLTGAEDFHADSLDRLIKLRKEAAAATDDEAAAIREKSVAVVEEIALELEREKAFLAEKNAQLALAAALKDKFGTVIDPNIRAAIDEANANIAEIEAALSRARNIVAGEVPSIGGHVGGRGIGGDVPAPTTLGFGALDTKAADKAARAVLTIQDELMDAIRGQTAAAQKNLDTIFATISTNQERYQAEIAFLAQTRDQLAATGQLSEKNIAILERGSAAALKRLAESEKSNSNLLERAAILGSVATAEERLIKLEEDLADAVKRGVINQTESNRVLARTKARMAEVTSGQTLLVQGMGAIDQALSGNMDRWQDWAKVAVSAIQQVIEQMIRANSTSGGGGGFNFGSLFDFGSAGGGGRASTAGTSSPGGIGGFAHGGRPPLGRVSIVGEAGPELFKPDVAGTILPNSALADLGGRERGALEGATVYMDLRGAGEGVKREVIRAVRQLRMDVPKISVAAVTDARQRNPRLFR